MAFDLAATRVRLQEFIKTTPAPRFVLFTSDWCPDCIRAVPPLKKTLAAAKLPLLEINVGGRPDWKSPSHPLRVDEGLKVTSIPTLLEWTENGPAKHRLASELENASSAAEVEKLVTNYIAAAQKSS